MENDYELIDSLKIENIKLKEENIKITKDLIAELEDNIRILQEKDKLFVRLLKTNELSLALTGDIQVALKALQEISSCDDCQSSEIANNVFKDLALRIKEREVV